MNKQRIVALLKKEFGQLFKDKKMLPLVFVAPVLQLIFMGYAASLDVKDISMVLCDLNKTEQSRELVSRLTNSGYFTLDYSTEDYKMVQHYLDEHRATMALIIPQDFSDKILRHESARVQVLLDGSEGNATAIANAYINQILVQYSTKILADVVGGPQSLGGVNAQVRAWFNPSLVSRNYMVPGVLVLILLITTTNLTAMAIVKEKEIGTLEQLMVTPITPTELILGKLVPFAIVGVVNWFVVIAAMVVGFGIVVKGSLLLLFGLTILFLLTTLGLGLFVSTVSRTQQQAMMTGQFFIIMPMMYLSGFSFPIENMPQILQIGSLAMPMRYYLIIVRSVILKGVGITNLWVEGGMLLIMGLGIFIASVKRFHKKME